MLDKQINMYSVDTGHFYSNKEKYLHNMNCKYRSERNYLSNRIKFMDDVMIEYGYTKQDLLLIKKGNISNLNIIPYTSDLLYEYFFWNSKIKHKQKKANESKEKILKLFSNKVKQNEMTNGKDHIRKLRKEDLNDLNVISVFDSFLTRSIGLKQDELTDEILVVQIYYFDVFKDISFFGFKYNDETYRYFTSSAGQIRKKKAVFIKETTWNKIEKTIMCGLTIDKINSKGGNNVNKHLAYMALSNSATDVWDEFNINKTIVVDDFETMVDGTFDFIDEKDYSITRKTGQAPIPHTDGAGMILPGLSKKNFMFRSPWVKGLLGVFDFRKFIEVNNCSPVIKDIYGKEHDVIKEDIQIIFTKSQFKMYKYYDSWDEYKHYFKKYNCTAGRCNIEEDRIKNAKINYQMLQTLTDITDEEIDLLTNKSSEKISNICNSKDSMMEILGVTPYNTNMTSFQKAIKIYPSLLTDTYAKDTIREVKNSLLKKYRSGKLEVSGKYTFILPDFYAACEYWFCHIDNPKGLLNDKEVFCWLFKNSEKLDCLRSPHLYKEHAIRFNIAHKVYTPKSELIREWFTTDGLYTSTHDLISRILQFDVDGDKSLVISDQNFIKIAERNMNNIVPLYYNMRKAEPVELNPENIYNGLKAAFTGGNIGLYSNDISKIWNNDVFIYGTDKDKQEAVDAVKLLCMENNFVIDYAKTLYKPERPKDKNAIINKYTHSKLPAFFEYAKDKKDSQVEVRNCSTVNKIFERIPDTSINTKSLKLEKLDYRKMMSNVNIRCSNEVSNLYNELNSEYRYMINMKDEYIDNLRYVACQVRSEFSKLGYSEEMITDMLVDYLYGNNKRHKQLLWFLYGQYIVNNLEKNIQLSKTKYVQCIDCGEWVEVKINSKRIRCDECAKKERRRIEREKKAKQRMSHQLT